MPRSIIDTKTPPELAKRLINLSLFIVALVVVVVIMTWEKGLSHRSLTGTIIIAASCFLVLYLFLHQFRRDVLIVSRKVFFILLAVISFTGITRLVTGLPGTDLVFIIPFAIIPVVIRTFYDARLAVIILLVTVMLSGFQVPQPFEFVFLNFISGTAAILTLKTAARKARLFFTSLMVIATYIVIWLGISLMVYEEIPADFSRSILLFALNGLMVLISYPLIFIFEQNFLLLSEATLYELTDTNHPLLRKFAEEAPGSYQHSLQVANLAEEAARVIGANYLIVRAGALYHDIGKIGNPKYYSENQADDISPHEKLDPNESARLIISHVRNGVTLAKNYKIPIQVIDFIKMHHGTTVAYFFFKKFLDQNPGMTNIEVAEKNFKYPGPKPFSKETAVVMMADAVEAASRSMVSYTEENISELVERILYLQEQDGQFSDVPLTFRDMSDIKDVLKRRLSNIYHPRIAYPERI